MTIRGFDALTRLQEAITKIEELPGSIPGTLDKYPLEELLRAAVRCTKREALVNVEAVYRELAEQVEERDREVSERLDRIEGNLLDLVAHRDALEEARRVARRAMVHEVEHVPAASAIHLRQAVDQMDEIILEWWNSKDRSDGQLSKREVLEGT